MADWWPDDGFFDDLVISANRRPSLSWTGEANYTTDGLHPESGNFSTSYAWRVKFTDGDNDTPSSIRVHILCNGAEISGSPFAMSYVSGAHNTGAVYSYSRTLSSPGNYTYYFDTTDGWLASMDTSVLAGPTVANNSPSLSWTGEAGYTTDGINPDAGNFSTTYTWHVKYTDTDNDAPSYLRLHVLCNGSAISGSPFNLAYVSGSHNTGSLYSYSRTISSPGSYTYYFETSDIWNAAANTSALSGPTILLPDISGYVRDPAGSPMPDTTVLLNGTETRSTVTDEFGLYRFYDLTGESDYSVSLSCPLYYIFSPSTHTFVNLITDQTNVDFVRLNRTPVLSWSGGDGYTSDGAEPDIGRPGDTFVFRIKHTDPDNDAPRLGYPRLLLSKDGTLEETLPMTYVSGDNRSGAIYSVSTVLDVVSDRYTYSFDGYDIWETSATFDSAPVVIVCSEPPTMPENRSEVAKDGASCISAAVSLSWAAVDPEGDTPRYTLYLSNPVSAQSTPGHYVEQIIYSPVYTGTSTAYRLSHLQPGKVYFWKVRAEDSLGLTSESPVFSFKTVDIAVDKTFNYPNPFNPTKQTTNIVFKTSRPQPVTIRLYSEYGDLVFETTFDAVAGTNEYRYDGRDSAGNMLYNGSYICRVSTQEGTSTCYILITK